MIPDDDDGCCTIERVREICRFCGFSVSGFRSDSTCVVTLDWQRLRATCQDQTRQGTAHTCAGLRDLLRHARAIR